MKIIVEIKFGSHLYGTATPKSDLDIRGIYIPCAKDILLQRIKPVITKKRSKRLSEKNLPGDIDYELYSPEKYLSCLAKGQSFALEMLFAPDWAIINQPHKKWYEIKKLAPQTEFISAAPIIDRLRSVKSSVELKDLRNTCKATLELLETFPDWVKVGMTENEVKAKLEYEYMKLGKPSFGAIVATGAHSADPHHNTSMKKIESFMTIQD